MEKKFYILAEEEKREVLLMRKSPQKRVVKAGSYQFRKKMTPWCILFFPMAFTVWLKYYPIVSAFFISLFRYDPINPPGNLLGLKIM